MEDTQTGIIHELLEE